MGASGGAAAAAAAASSNLSLDKVVEHGRSGEAHGVVQDLEVQRAEKDVGHAEGRHARDVAARVLQSPALVRHAVAFGCTELEVMLVPWPINLFLQRSRLVGPLK